MTLNTVETIKVPASFLVSGVNELTDDIKQRLLSLTQLTDESARALEKEGIAMALPPEMQKALAFIGAQLPVDIIELNMRLGDMIFHVWSFYAKPAQAPLAIKRHEKRAMELAEIFDKESFGDLPEDVKTVLVKVMESQDLWEKTQFGAYVIVNGETRYLGLTAMGASCFTKTVSAAAELVV